MFIWSSKNIKSQFKSTFFFSWSYVQVKNCLLAVFSLLRFDLFYFEQMTSTPVKISRSKCLGQYFSLNIPFKIRLWSKFDFGPVQNIPFKISCSKYPIQIRLWSRSKDAILFKKNQRPKKDLIFAQYYNFYRF